MERYDYKDQETKDVLEWIENNIDREDYETREDLEDYLNDTLWVEDSVTGNGSGSYTFSSYVAEENLLHNLDLLADACHEFGSSVDILKEGAEACDVTIRCYLLSECISAALDEWWEDDEETEEE